MDTLFLSSNQRVSVRLHPSVVFSILDHHIRRNAGAQRVIGTLLGVVRDGLLLVQSCFPVPHSEGEQVSIDSDFHKNMVELHQRAFPRESVVGWYSSSTDMTEYSVMYHEFFSHECAIQPVHVTVDTALQGGALNIAAFVSAPMTLGDKRLGCFFQPVPVVVASGQAEKTALNVLNRAKSSANGKSKVGTDMASLQLSLAKLLEMINEVHSFVSDTIEGKRVADEEVGRYLYNVLSPLPHLDSALVDSVVHESIQDLLMVAYLANFTRAQLVLADKIQQLY